MTDIDNLIELNYSGCSVFSLLRNPIFREELLNSSKTFIRGNELEKNTLLDQLAISAKALIVGPAGEGKSLFARKVLEALADSLSNHKFKIAGCPINQDAAIIKMMSEINEKETKTYLTLLKDILCPNCTSKIENLISESLNNEISLTRTNEIINRLNYTELLSLFKTIEVERVEMHAAQIDPRTDQDSIYMLLAGVENLERLLSEKTKTAFDPSTHKIGVLSQGLILVNEVHRLPIRLLESLMGFLEEAGTLRYSIAGRMLTIDGAIIFTANSPLKQQLGEEITPLLSRIPMVLWPTRNLEERKKIVLDIFQEHLYRFSSPLGYTDIGVTFSKFKSFPVVSQLTVELIARVVTQSFPEALFYSNRPQEFLNNLGVMQSTPNIPFFDTRTLYQLIGKLILNLERSQDDSLITYNDVVPFLLKLGFDNEVGKALNQLKILIGDAILGQTTVELDIESIEKDQRVLEEKIQNQEEFQEIIFHIEGFNKINNVLDQKNLDKLLESYSRLMEES